MTGVVLEIDHRPVVGAQVEIWYSFQVGSWKESYFAAQSEPATTGPDGVFKLPAVHIPRGSSLGVDIKISKAGFEDAWLRSLDETIREELEISLRRLGTLSGRVLTEDREPVAGAQVQATARASGLPVAGLEEVGAARTTTDKKGLFTIHNVPLGPSALVVEAPGFAPEERAVELEPEEALDLELILQREVTLRGFVLREGGAPAENAIVQVGSKFTESGPGGEFAFTKLKPGRHIIQAGHREIGRTSVEVLLDIDSDPISLVLRAQATAQGTVVDREDRPVPGASVFVTDDSGSSSAAFTKEDGTFQFLDLKPGRYSVLAAATGMVAAAPELFVLSASSESPPWRIVLQPNGTVEGTIFGDSDLLPGQVKVKWSCPDGTSTSGVVTSDGSFLIENARLGECWVIAQAAGTTQVTAKRLQLTTLEPRRSINLSFNDLAGLEGLLTHNGQRLDGARVWIFTPNGAAVAETRSNWSGDFNFSGLAPGDYRLAVDIAGRPLFFDQLVSVPSSKPLIWNIVERNPNTLEPS